MNILISVLYYFCFLFLGGLSLFIYFKGRTSRLNQFFSLFTLFLLGWLITLFMLYGTSDLPYLTFIGRANFASIGVAVVLAVFFTRELTKLRKRRPLALFLAIEGAVLFGVTLFTPLIDTHEQVVNGELVTHFGPLYWLYFAHIVIYLFGTVYLMIRGLRRSNEVIKAQIEMIVIGFTVTALVSVFTNIVLPFGFHNFDFQEIGPLSVIVLLVSFAYAITVHHLFDVRLIIKRTVVYTALLAFVFAAYTAFVLFLTRILNVSQQSFIANLIIALLIGLSFEPLRNWLSERTDRWLFKKEYEQQSVLKDLSQKLNNVIGLDEALEGVMQTIVKVLHLRHAVTYVFQPGEQNTLGIKRVKQIGYVSSINLLLEEKDFTVRYFTDNPNVCILDDFRLEVEQEREIIEGKKAAGDFIRQHAIKQAVLKKLTTLGVAIAIPLHLNSQPLGLVLLSEKLSGERFSAQDLTLLDLVGAQAISSIQKAKLFEGDQMKSEFVSIASHELLTPISAIEGYLSMILEENIGKVDPQARDYLNKVYTSAKRLSLLIKDLLSVSRIESGKMKIDLQQLDMAKMITDTIDQLKFVAADKKLSIQFMKPEKDLPPVWADPDRTMQVLVNLVSNAIKYTPSGKVTVTAHSDRHTGLVSISVEDTGLGMNKTQMAHLFTKFYRVDTPETSGIGGTGLGLYITKSIIEKMGGTITCKSTPGHGSTFSFTLPIFKVETSVVA